MLFPAADPAKEFPEAAVAEPLVSQAYVYLLRVVTPAEQLQNKPIAKMPLVLFPAADPYAEAMLEDVAEAFVSVEYVYLFRVVVGALN